MFEWKTVFVTLGVICLIFFAIPVKIQHKRSSNELLFQAFVTKYDKSYRNNITEYGKRLRHFEEALRVIEILNANRTEHDALYGITPFCDLSPDEFRKRHLGRRARRNSDGSSEEHRHPRKARAAGEIPETFDWRTKKVITPIRNQGVCGACWAFSTVETMESMKAIKTNGSLTPLSVQEIIDCAGNGNNGCEGGDNRLLLQWLVLTKVKVEPEKNYPYNHMDNACKYKGSEDGVQVSSYSCSNMINIEDSLMATIANHGPVAVAVNAGNWQYYLGGVIQYHCSGGLSDLNHAVQLVGYVNSGDTPYYIARNSWGPLFGDKGYLYLKIGSNMCGLANEVCSLDVV